MHARILCLGALASGDLSGYDIRKRFEEGPFRHFQDISFGSIYPALRQLTEEGLVREVEAPEESEARPDRKVFAITEAGLRALREAVNRDPAPDKFRSDMLFSLFFCEMIEPDRVERMILNRLAESRALLDYIETCEGIEHPGRAFVIGLGRVIHRAEVAFLEAQRQTLVDLLRRRAPAATTPEPATSDAAD